VKPFSPSLYVLVMGALACAAGGCKSRDHNEARVELYSKKGILNDDTADPNWIYNGKLPQLVDPRLIVSLKSHTVRINGWAPAGFDTSTLPDYVHVDDLGGKKRLMVVFPIATVDPGQNPKGNAPGSYYDVKIFPWTPRGVGENKNTSWGGFPYIEYEHGRNIDADITVLCSGDAKHESATKSIRAGSPESLVSVTNDFDKIVGGSPGWQTLGR